MLVILMLNCWFDCERYIFVEKAVGYVICVIAVYFLQNMGEHNGVYYQVTDFLFFIIAIAFAIKIRFSADKSFKLTPMDFLVVSLVLVVPNVPGIGLEEDHVGEMAIKLVVLFYAVEAVFNTVKTKMNILRVGMFLSLLIAMFRGI